MIDDDDDDNDNDNGKPTKVRFGRSQKFRLTATGTDAASSYTEMIEAARKGSGRSDFDAARKAWAAPLGLASEDGLFLVEFGKDGRTLQEAAANLDGCGTAAKEVKVALERLMEKGLLEAVPAPPEPLRAPPVNRFRY